MALAAIAARAQVPASDDCHMWNEGDYTTQSWYLGGLFHGMVLAPREARVPYLPNVSIKDIHNGVTEICKAPENANVDLLLVLTVFKLKLDGASQKAVEEMLREARQAAAESKK